ncbi:seminal plasma protein BSP-30 kDa-like [Dama dama]|uniref:seminal plasma protein BSP-30 kDa-like n=1 Tax=Dama dama TaxID=30532 RepID=UPI002A3669F8|nr:seminal plasma protein BSP-30 kDa-like [Dama dama]
MAPRLGLFLIWAGASMFLQLHPVNAGDPPDPGSKPTPPATVSNGDFARVTRDHESLRVKEGNKDFLLPGPPCAFPFTYRGVKYYKCTSVDFTTEWCSLDEHYVGRRKTCSREDRPKCHFPFTYRKKRYFRCTTEGSAYGYAWCPLTANFEQDYIWQYCD